MSKIKTSELNDKSEYGLGSYDFLKEVVLQGLEIVKL